MSKSIDQLRADYEKAEQNAQKLMADRDEAVAKARDRFGDRLRDATNAAAEAQALLLDTEVHESLQDRPDGESVAAKLRGEAEQSLAASAVVRHTGPDGTIDYEAVEGELRVLKDRAAALGFPHLPFSSSE